MLGLCFSPTTTTTTTTRAVLLLLFVVVSQVDVVSGQSGFCAVGSEDTCVVGSHWVQTILHEAVGLQIKSLSPELGPVGGGTEVIVWAEGIRDFGRLMKCRFGDIVVPATLRTLPGDLENVFNIGSVVCGVPSALNASRVAVDITLTGETFSNDAVLFTYYDPPTIDFISPASGTTRGGTPIAVTGAGFLGNQDAGLEPEITCRFTAQVDPAGQMQVPMQTTTTGEVLVNQSGTVVTCQSPPSQFLGDVLLEISLNQQNFGPAAKTFVYEDAWHMPHISGNAPSGRWFHSMTYLETPTPRLIVFGGFDGSARSDLHILFLDVMGDFYPSSSSYDLTWADYSDRSLTTGQWPTERMQHTTEYISNFLYVFGGLSDFRGAPHTTVHRLDTNSMEWETINTTGSLPTGRVQHSTTVVGNRIFLFGGRSLELCGYGPDRPCLIEMNDSYFFDVETHVWSEATSLSSVNTTSLQPSPRKGHTTTTIEANVLLFGGVVVESQDSSAVLENDLMIFLSRTGEWETLSPNNLPGGFPEPRELHTTVAIDQRYLCVFGGRGAAGALNDLWLYDTVLNVWSVKEYSGSASGRFGHAAAAVSATRVAVWGGFDLNGRLNNDLSLLDPLEEEDL